MLTVARIRRLPLVAGLLAVGTTRTLQAPVPMPLSGLVWRNIGPFRAGRVSAVSGAVGAAGVFYAGFPTGGLWKTANAGTTWVPVFDDIKTTSSIGAVQVAPSDTSVVYVGTGDMPTGGNINEGDGVYKSVDGGRTWRHIGLEETRQIPSILVDPRDPNLVLVAGQGNRFAKGGQRGVFRSTDGGQTWSKTLDTGDSIGVERLAWANDEPSTVLAATDRHWVNVAAIFAGRPQAPGNGATGTSLYKSTDEGLTWHELTGGGLPRLAGRISVAVAMHTNGQRMFLITGAGLYRSDDGGATWRQMAAGDSRIATGQGGYNCGVYVSSSNPDVVITINTSSYISTDGGNTFTGFKGAPGGDDPQQLWIDPSDGQRMLLGLDQGATVTLDGGRTWSSWYNQSTEQVYHISVDSSFPYYVYASQQDAGAIRTRSRGNYGAITPGDWNPVGGWEWGTDIVDPLDNNVVYASGVGIQRITYPTEQVIDISPGVDPTLRLRNTASMPILFPPWNPRELLVGYQYLMATTDGGKHWRKLSPNLGYAKGVTPLPDTTTPSPSRRPGGIIDCLSASAVARGMIWAGTNNGLIKLTRNEGQTWTDVSIPDLPDSNFSDVQTIEASRFHPGEAYAAVDAHFFGDYRPQLYRTRDYGRTWTKIVAGLPTGEIGGSFTHVIREDTKRAGLLFAGTESGIYVSFDDGDQWQSLQQNLPTTSVRDALIRGNDLVVGTYGRGIWILDDISPLRQVTPAAVTEPVHLFKPAMTIRLHRNTNGDTPYPPEVPQADNPPDGVVLYYSLDAARTSEITLDVLDSSNRLVRHLSSTPAAPVLEAANPPAPSFWLSAPSSLPAAPGVNRATWDLRYERPQAFTHTYEINANPGRTPPAPEGPMVMPGLYRVRLTVDGKLYMDTVRVVNDPRSKATAAALGRQHDLQMRIVTGLQVSWDAYRQAAALRRSLLPDTAGVPAEVARKASAILARIDTVAGDSAAPFRFFKNNVPAGFVDVSSNLVTLLKGLDLADEAPNEATEAAYESSCGDLRHDLAVWSQLLRDVGDVNAALATNGLARVGADLPVRSAPVCRVHAEARAR